MSNSHRFNFIRFMFILLFTTLTLLAGCASTKVVTSGSPIKQPLCSANTPAVTTEVFWRTQWRENQKEPALREAAALRGILDFLSRTSCITVAGIHRLPANQALNSDEEHLRLVSTSTPKPERVLLIVVRELGPRLVIGLPVIVEGGTEVVIDARVLNSQTSESLSNVQTSWRNGGTFVIKGVKTLDQDMSAALSAALLPDHKLE